MDETVKNFTMRKVTKYFSLNIRREKLNLSLKLEETTFSLIKKTRERRKLLERILLSLLGWDEKK